MRILGRLGMYFTLFGIVLATAVWADAPPDPWYLQAIQQVPIWLVFAIITAGLVVWLIAFLAKSLRRTLVFAALAIGILLLITLALKVDAYVLRHRAERLLADVQGLEVRKTTLVEARRVLQKWRKPTPHSECDRNNCRFIISLADSISSMKAGHLPTDTTWGWISWMEWAAKFFGRRDASF